MRSKAPHQSYHISMLLSINNISCLRKRLSEIIYLTAIHRFFERCTPHLPFINFFLFISFHLSAMLSTCNMTLFNSFMLDAQKYTLSVLRSHQQMLFTEYYISEYLTINHATIRSPLFTHNSHIAYRSTRMPQKRTWWTWTYLLEISRISFIG